MCPNSCSRVKIKHGEQVFLLETIGIIRYFFQSWLEALVIPYLNFSSNLNVAVGIHFGS